MELPKFLIKALKHNMTSLGDNPAFPPEEEENFVLTLVRNYLNDIDVTTADEDELSRLMSECKKIEKDNINSLSELCIETIQKLFDIPEDTIKINANIVNKIDVSKERLLPEKNVNYTFDNITDMKYLTDEIYKRRFLNALVSGASMYYASEYKNYVEKLFQINSDLPSLYKKIYDINNALLYCNEKVSYEKNSGGNVEVCISGNDNMVTINSNGIFFNILLEETIKGLLELAISHGLPKQKEKAEYVISKSDFKFAEIWDMRIGLPMWVKIKNIFDDLNYDPIKVGLNFIFMEISSLEPKKFNEVMKEVLANTNTGKKLLTNLVQYIEKQKGQDEFNDYIKQNSNDVTLTDSIYYTADELKNEFC